jgi:hypothetical protein
MFFPEAAPSLSERDVFTPRTIYLLGYGPRRLCLPHSFQNSKDGPQAVFAKDRTKSSLTSARPNDDGADSVPAALDFV